MPGLYFKYKKNITYVTTLRPLLQIQEEFDHCVKLRQTQPKLSELCEALLNVNCILHSILFHIAVFQVLLAMVKVRLFSP